MSGPSLLRHDGDTLVAELCERPDDGVVRVFWLGQSGFALRAGDECLLIDPYLSDSLTRKYANTDTPHVRMYPRVVPPEALADAPVTAILSTHHHTDHLDPDTLRPLIAALAARGRADVPLVVPEAWRQLAAERAGVQPPSIVGMDEGRTTTAGGFEIVGVPASHEAIEYDAAGHRKCLGYVIRWGGVAIHHSGDTLLFDGQAERLRPFALRLALLPINGKVGNMSGVDAARLAHAAGAALVVPCHYDMFEFNTADPGEAFVPECERLGQPYKVLAMGESVTVGAAGAGGDRRPPWGGKRS